MYDFIYKIWFYLQSGMCLGWERRKKPERERKTKTNKTKENQFPVWLLSHPPIYDMEADCFSVSKKTENKPDPD